MLVSVGRDARSVVCRRAVFVLVVPVLAVVSRFSVSSGGCFRRGVSVAVLAVLFLSALLALPRRRLPVVSPL